MWSVLVSLGTRPEAIKLAPIIHRLQAEPDLQASVVNVGQHAEMLDETLASFGIEVGHRLQIIKPGASLDDLTARGLRAIGRVLDAESPDMVVVQGDTTTVFVTALAAFYRGVPVAHVEAGLRTWIPDLPFPEEMNRRLTAPLTTLHFAPTKGARANLLAENVPEESITVTGNPVIDALQWMLAHGAPPPVEVQQLLDDSRRMLVVTAHRRESWGAPMEEIGQALATLAEADQELLCVFPIHPNPVVRAAIGPKVGALGNIKIIEPQPYHSFVRLLARADLLLTDSGGIQEEAAALGKPVLVMRDVTERPEGVAGGTAELVGRSASDIASGVRRLLGEPALYAARAAAPNPYGDGRAAERIAGRIMTFFQQGARDARMSRPAAPARPQ